jgi:hypothetical protein
MREREGKERGEILNEDGRIYERDMEEEEKDRGGKRGVGDRNPKARGPKYRPVDVRIKLSEHPLN